MKNWTLLGKVVMSKMFVLWEEDDTYGLRWQEGELTCLFYIGVVGTYKAPWKFHGIKSHSGLSIVRRRCGILSAFVYGVCEKDSQNMLIIIRRFKMDACSTSRHFLNRNAFPILLDKKRKDLSDARQREERPSDSLAY